MNIFCTVAPPKVASQVLLNGSKEMEVTGHDIGTVGIMVHNLPVVAPQLITGPVGTRGLSENIGGDVVEV
jgi:hypothetical protein